ncbi:hypothetical protein ABI59_09855 [Acidobacteria bacterium Mor1]|nr:hypothetical protein ABI59_09855 [Acidobacteria bacterium Mor1]
MPVLAEQNWTGFRNEGTGRIQADGVPTSWAPDRNIAWNAPIPGYGQSAPVIWKDTVFVTSSDGPWQETGFVHAYDLAGGALKWSTSVPATTKFENYFRNSRAAPTPVVDEQRVVSFFPGGDLTAMDHHGRVLWTVPLFRKFGMPENERGTAGSLAQSKDLVFAVIDHAGPSYAVALRKSDGAIAWKVARGTREASWTSPVVMRHEGRELLVISSAGSVDGYVAETGAFAFQVSGFQGNLIPSLTVHAGSLFVGSTEMFHGNYDPDTVAASNSRIDLLGGKGATYRFRWGTEKANAYYASPLVFAGYVYYVNKSGVLYAVDAGSGERVFAARLGKPCWASPIGITDRHGNPRVYFFMKSGEAVVLRPGKTFDVVSRNKLWTRATMEAAASEARTLRRTNRVPEGEAPPKEGPEKVLGSLPESALHRVFSYGDPIAYAAAAVDGNLLIRTGQQLFCVRQDEAP